MQSELDERKSDHERASPRRPLRSFRPPARLALLSFVAVQALATGCASSPHPQMEPLQPGRQWNRSPPAKWYETRQVGFAEYFAYAFVALPPAIGTQPLSVDALQEYLELAVAAQEYTDEEIEAGIVGACVAMSIVHDDFWFIEGSVRFGILFRLMFEYSSRPPREVGLWSCGFLDWKALNSVDPAFVQQVQCPILWVDGQPQMPAVAVQGGGSTGRTLAPIEEFRLARSQFPRRRLSELDQFKEFMSIEYFLEFENPPIQQRYREHEHEHELGLNTFLRLGQPHDV